MKPFIEWSIRTKLMLLILGVALTVVIPISGARLAWDYQQSKDLMSQELTTLANLLAHRTDAALIFHDESLANENLASLNSLPNIKLACIYDGNDALFAEHKKLVKGCAQFSTGFKNKNWFADDSFHIVAPVGQGNIELGKIYLVSDLSMINQRLRQQFTFSGFALLVVVLIAGLITGWIRQLIAGPIETTLEKYRSLFDYANDVILLTDAESGQILDINPAATQLYGYSRDKLLSMSINSLTHPATLINESQSPEPPMLDNEAVYERIHYSKDGTQIPVEVSSRQVMLDNRSAILSIVRNLSERKKVENALAESEIRFRALIEQSPIGTQILTTDGYTRMVNPAWEEFWGIKAEALRDYNILKDKKLEAKGILPYIKQGFAGIATDIPPVLYNPAEMNNDIDSQLSQNRWVRGFIYPIKDNKGNVSEVILTQEDVTDKKFTEEAIKNIAAGVSAEIGEVFFEQLVLYLGKLFNTKYAFIGLIDENDSSLVNTLALGIDGEIAPNLSYQLVSSPCENVINDSDTCSHITGVQQEFPKDNLLKEMEAESYIGTPLFDINGQPLGLIVLIDDKPLGKVEWIKEILQIFAARASAELIRMRAEKDLYIKDRAMEVAIEGIILTDASDDFKIIYANRSMENITGYSRTELLGKNLSLLQGEKTDRESAARLQDSLRNRQPCKVSITNYRKDKKAFFNEITLTPVKNERGEATHFIATCVDTTDRRQTEDALRRSQKMEAVGQLAGGIAHDFNNQLGIIIGYLDFLRDRVAGEEKPAKWVETASLATNRCIDLTRQLLIFSRRKPNETVLTNINDELVKMDTLISRSITPAISVKTFTADNLWPVSIDPGEFQDVILNLVINARDAMPDGGSLLIETSNKPVDELFRKQNPNLNEDEDYIQIMVSDTGMGMAKETIDRVFEPFFTTKPEGKGTGLGLSMVYGFANRYGGDIKVYSEPGEGTTFRIYLPRSKEDKDLVIKKAASYGDLPTGTETILVVDDEEDLLALAEEYLRSLGYSTYSANNGESALKLLKEHPDIDMLFSDVVMPGGMNGFELATNSVAFKPDIKVLLTSGFTAKTIAENIQKSYLDDLLHKPYRKNDLAISIRSKLDKDHESPNIVKELKSTDKVRNSDLENHTVFVIDDNKDVRDLYKLNIDKLGCKTIEASDGDNAIKVLEEYINNGEQIDVFIIDFEIPGSMDGKTVADKIRSIYPEAKVIISSGDSDRLEMTQYEDYGFNAALEKNFDRDTIEKVLKKVLRIAS